MRGLRVSCIRGIAAAGSETDEVDAVKMEEE
jgi:hypothetical protein